MFLNCFLSIPVVYSTFSNVGREDILDFPTWLYNYTGELSLRNLRHQKIERRLYSQTEVSDPRTSYRALKQPTNHHRQLHGFPYLCSRIDNMGHQSHALEPQHLQPEWSNLLLLSSMGGFSMS
jgi:hypothetical protein